MKKILSNILLGLVSILLLLALAEFALWLVRPEIPVWRAVSGTTAYVYPSEYSDRLPFTLPVNTVMEHAFPTPPRSVTYRFNACGLRGPFCPGQDQTPGKRVLILGDSFTFGWRMDEADTYPAMLQTLLDQGGQDWRVINAGYHGGYSPDAYYASLRDEWDVFRPDIVVVQLYLGNDIQDVADNRWIETDEKGLPRRIETTRNYVNHRGEYNARHQACYQYSILRESRMFIGLCQALGRLDRKPAADPEASFQASLAGIAGLAREHGAQLLFVLVPPIVMPATDPLTGPVTYDLADPALARTRDFLEKDLGARVLDLATAFSRVADLPSLAIPGDGHFSVAGNHVVAELLYRALVPGTGSSEAASPVPAQP